MRKLSLPVQIGLIVAIALAGFLVVGGIFQVSTLRLDALRTEQKTALAGAGLAQEIKYDILNARRHEKDFLARRQERHVELHAKTLQQVEKRFREIRKLHDEPETLKLIDEVKAGVQDYGNHFGAIVDLWQRAGLTDKDGLRGHLRNSVHKAETQLKEANAQGLTILMLMMRRHEKDFLLREEAKYLEEIKQRQQEFAKALEAAGLPPALRQDISRNMEIYAVDFEKVAANVQQVAATTEKMRENFARVEPLMRKLVEDSEKDFDEAEEKARRVTAETFWLMTGGMLGITLLVTVVAWLIGRAIARRLNGIVETMGCLAAGDLTVEVPDRDLSNEIGRMAQATQVFKDNALEMRRLEARAEADRRLAEEEKKRAIHDFATEIAGLAEAAGRGELSARLSLEGKEGELRSMCESLNRMVAIVQQGLDETGAVLHAMAEGDLRVRVKGDYQGAYHALMTDTNAMATHLSDVVDRIVAGAGSIRDATSEIAEGTTDLAHRTEQQASNLEETAAAMEELTTTVRQNAENARLANDLSIAASTTAEKGGGIVSEATEAMGRIEESSGKISDIVNMIDEIAFQTNLLALNAAVEAARAGDAGKGFAVVASEVRALAQRSSEASKEIKSLIAASSNEVRGGVALVKRTGDTLKEIVGGIKRVADVVSQIATASREQATGLDEVNTAVSNMDGMTQQNAALVEEATAATHSLSHQAIELADLISFFRTGTEAAPATKAKPAPKPTRAAAAPTVAPLPPNSPHDDKDWGEF